MADRTGLQLKKRAHNIELEQAMLGAILMDGTALDAVSDFLRPDHFYEPLHGRIYDLCSRLTTGGVAPPLPLLNSHFDMSETVGQITVRQYLGRLISAATSTLNARGYGEALANLAHLRELTDACEEIASAASDPAGETPADVLIAEAERRIGAISTGSHADRETSCTVGVTAERLVDSLLSGNAGPLQVSTGLVDLDAVIGGWRPGALYILGGRPSMGKSMAAVSFAMAAAQRNVGVLYASLEMTHEALCARCLTDIAFEHARDLEIQYGAILNRKLSGDAIEALARAELALRGLPLLVDDQRGVAVAEIARKARQYSAKLEADGLFLGLVIVDHIGLIRPSDRYSGLRAHEVGEIVNDLATLAKRLGVAVLALHQLNRGVEGREEKRPGMADLRDSGNVEEHADVVMFPYRPAYYLERIKFDDEDRDLKRQSLLRQKRNIIEFIIGKNRNGECRTVEAFAHAGCNAVRDIIVMGN